jgi:hypothetical protein
MLFVQGILLHAYMLMDFHDRNRRKHIQLVYMLHNVTNALNGGWLIHKKSLKRSEVN